MNKHLIWLLVLGLTAIAGGMVGKGFRPAEPVAAVVTVARALGDAAGFAQALAPRPFLFPADHGPHPDFRHEWWYVTGNVLDTGGRPFGFQFTLFRIALSPDAPVARASAWAASQLYMGHLALTDGRAGRFHHAQRLARGALGLAGATNPPLRAWVEGWQLTETHADPFTLRLQAAADGFALDLTLTARKPVVPQGEQGLSRKGEALGAASHYYSLTRLETTGIVSGTDGDHAVQGSAWLDREWGSGSLGDQLAGWDWFAVQLDQGWEVMYYRLRRPDGSAAPHSHGVLVDPAGRTTPLAITLRQTGSWRSPHSGVTYPAGWRLTAPVLELELTPRLADQELHQTSVRYWEGAVTVSGHLHGQPTGGVGYTELAGY